MTPQSVRDFYPERRGADIFVTINGQKKKLSPMQSNLILQAWAREVGAALVAGVYSARSEGKDL